jgi:hypothetical protein
MNYHLSVSLFSANSFVFFRAFNQEFKVKTRSHRKHETQRHSMAEAQLGMLFHIARLHLPCMLIIYISLHVSTTNSPQIGKVHYRRAKRRTLKLGCFNLCVNISSNKQKIIH